MLTSQRKTYFLAAAIGLAAAVAIFAAYVYQLAGHDSIARAAINQPEATTPQPPTPSPALPPLQVTIPKLKLAVPLTPVGLTATGEMDVPQNSNYAGWYQLGTLPGEIGSAVLDGHNRVLGRSKGVFGDIYKLAAGDDIYVQDGSAVEQHFVVTRSVKYSATNAPLTEIFGAADKAHLNLITCAGRWDASNKRYSQRLVVYTDLVSK
jgi:sortase A